MHMKHTGQLCAVVKHVRVNQLSKHWQNTRELEFYLQMCVTSKIYQIDNTKLANSAPPLYENMVKDRICVGSNASTLWRRIQKKAQVQCIILILKDPDI